MRADPDRESLRWGRAVQACDGQLGLETRAIHVMDREGDSYDLLAELHAAGARYVIRLAHDRRLVGEHEKLRQVVGRATCLFRREVRVNPHGAGRPKDHHAVRQAREATLDVSAMAVELARSSNFALGSPPSLNAQERLPDRETADGELRSSAHRAGVVSSHRRTPARPCETQHAASPTLLVPRCLRGTSRCCAPAATDP